MTENQKVPKVPGILHNRRTLIVCPYACDSVIHYHGVFINEAREVARSCGPKGAHCFWYLKEEPKTAGYEIVPATTEQEQIIRNWLPRALKLRSIKFHAAQDEERRHVLAQLIGEENLPPRPKSKLSRHLSRDG